MAEANEQMGVTAEAVHKTGPLWTEARMASFLACLAEEKTMAAACRRLGLKCDSVRDARRRYPDFDRAVGEIRLAIGRAGKPGGPDAAGADAKAAKKQRRFRGGAAENERFLALLTEHGGVRTVALMMGVTTASLYEARDRDPDFRAAWDKAALIYAEVAESEVLRKAVDGGGDVRVSSEIVARRKASLGTAVSAEGRAGGPAHRAEIEASRHELEERLASLIERHGDPFVMDAAADGDVTPGEVAA